MKKLFCLLLAIILPNLCFSFKFRFNDKKGDKYIITTQTIQNVLINNNPIVTVDQRHKGELTVIGQKRDKVIIQGKYDFYQRPIGSNDAYRATNARSYKTRYSRTTLGKMKVGTKFFYPIVRNVPIFPKKNINIGETWEAVGQESQDFRKRGIPRPYLYKIRVFYRYVKDVVYKNKKCAIIEYFYYVNQRLRTPIRHGAFNGLSPARFFGFVKGKYYWDKKAGHPVYYENVYNFVLINKNGTTNEYKGRDKGKITKVPVITREDETNIARQINRTIRDTNIPAHIRRDNRGIAVNFKGEVLFGFSSYKLKEKAKKELNRIVALLKKLQKKHPSIEFRVEGHADSIGRADRKQFFSDQRAKIVTNYLIRRGIDTSRISYRGFSDSRPVGSNRTEQGRKKNRRVEIIIVTR